MQDDHNSLSNSTPQGPLHLAKPCARLSSVKLSYVPSKSHGLAGTKIEKGTKQHKISFIDEVLAACS
eukprot:5175708-Amphidinium_carterae.2